MREYALARAASRISMRGRGLATLLVRWIVEVIFQKIGDAETAEKRAYAISLC
jgi:hypothetical protein